MVLGRSHSRPSGTIGWGRCARAAERAAAPPPPAPCTRHHSRSCLAMPLLAVGDHTHPIGRQTLAQNDARTRSFGAVSLLSFNKGPQLCCGRTTVELATIRRRRATPLSAHTTRYACFGETSSHLRRARLRCVFGARPRLAAAETVSDVQLDACLVPHSPLASRSARARSGPQRLHARTMCARQVAQRLFDWTPLARRPSTPSQLTGPQLSPP